MLQPQPRPPSSDHFSCVYCSQWIVHHIKFCPVNLRLISCSALGSLDTSSGGTTVLLREGSVGRENRLLFIRRLAVVVFVG